MRRVWLAVLVEASLLCCAAAANAMEPAIAYTGGGEIKVIGPDGAGRRTLTATPPGYNSLAPAWSVDGAVLGFVRAPELVERKRRSRLVLLDVGTRDTRVLRYGAVSRTPSFSPDGRSVAYSAEVEVGDAGSTSALKIADVDGSEERVLTQPSVGAAYDADPAWSPDGLRIAFTRLPSFGATPEIWTISIDGSEAQRLATDGLDPAWSPDGSQVAFVSTRDSNGVTCFHDCSPNAEIYVMDASGANQRRLTYTKTDEADPAWSPDGTQIAFASARPIPEGNPELYSMRADGSCMTRLTNTSVSNSAPAWRPTGSFSSPLVCDGVVPAARAPVMETDLRPARQHRGFPLAWLGPSYRGALLSAVDVGQFVTFIYDDCGRSSGECPLLNVQVQSWSICQRDPLRYGGYAGPGEPDHTPHVGHYRRVGRALLASHEFGVDVYAGPATITVFGSPSFRRAVAIASRLRHLRGGASALRPPRFSGRTLRRTRTVRRALRRHGMRALSRRWHMSSDQIEAASKLRRVLRGSELRRSTSC